MFWDASKVRSLLNLSKLGVLEFLELLYSSGLRISELIGLEFKNIDLNDCIIRVMGKGSKERIVPINDVAIHYLKVYVKDYRHLLVKKEQNNFLYLNISYF